MAASDGRKIRLYSMLALHAEEMSLKLERGTDALVDALDDADVGEVLAPARPSAVRKKRFGIF